MQIITFVNHTSEELYFFARCLNLKLPRREFPALFEIQDAVYLDFFWIQQTFSDWIELIKDDGKAHSKLGDSRTGKEDEMGLLSKIIKILNDTYGLNLTDDDQVNMAWMKDLLWDKEELKAVMLRNNNDDNKQYKFEKDLEALLLKYVDQKFELYKINRS